MEQLEIKTALQISKSANEIYKAIIDPQKMSNYFIAESSGNIVEGTTVTWKFPEFEGEVQIKVGKVIPNELVSFEWEGAKGKNLEVEIFMKELQDGTTIVRITEGKMEADTAGIQWFGGNTEGWANFLACLKAYMEHGINLRQGAFEFRRGEF